MGSICVYSYGCCFNEGSSNQLGAFAVYYGPGDPRNRAQTLPGKEQTAGRAELLAINCVLKELADTNTGKSKTTIYVVSNSDYACHILTRGYPGHAAHDWKTTGGGPVPNAKLIVETKKLMMASNDDIQLRPTPEIDEEEGLLIACEMAKKVANQA